MNFAKAPANDFAAFIHAYFSRCCQVCPTLRLVGGKWRFADLIPGLSDFDTRLLAGDETTVSDWMNISVAVGKLHGDMAREFPHWSRNLEHLPGVNLSAAELTDPLTYYPEFKQWSFYEGDAAYRRRIEDFLAGVRWSARDEAYHLKRLAIYIGPYQRGIDPPINLGPWESKYPLHSRLMHYFAPPVQALVSLARKETIAGKFDALRLAQGRLPQPAVIDEVLAIIAEHYERPELYADPALGHLERRLEDYLLEAWHCLAGRLELVDAAAGDDAATVRKKIAAIPVDPVQRFFDAAKFCRLMKGRLQFYAQKIETFESAWLIRNELGRIVANFYTTPLVGFGRAVLGRELSPEQVLDELAHDPLTPELASGMKRFAELAGRPIAAGGERTAALAVAQAYDPVLPVLDILAGKLRATVG